MISPQPPAPLAAVPVSPAFRWLFLVVAVLTFVTGLVMFVAPGPAGAQWWPWALTPHVARYFASLFLAVSVGALFAARLPWWEQIRAMVLPGVVFTGLALLSALIHFGSFNPARIVTWLYLALYALVFFVALFLALQHEQRYRLARR